MSNITFFFFNVVFPSCLKKKNDMSQRKWSTSWKCWAELDCVSVHGESPGTAGSCRCCRSRWNNTAPGRSCHRRLPPAGPTVAQHAASGPPAGPRMRRSDPLAKRRERESTVKQSERFVCGEEPKLCDVQEVRQVRTLDVTQHRVSSQPLLWLVLQ